METKTDSDYTINELKDKLDSKNISYKSNDNKADLIARLEESDKEEKKDEIKFSKIAMLRHKDFGRDKLILATILNDEDKYTVDEAKQLVKEFKEKEVEL